MKKHLLYSEIDSEGILAHYNSKNQVAWKGLIHEGYYVLPNEQKPESSFCLESEADAVLFLATGKIRNRLKD
jgi:hypothetical protein